MGIPLFIWGKLRLMRPFLQNLRSHSNETAAQVPEASFFFFKKKSFIYYTCVMCVHVHMCGHIGVHVYEEA